MTDFETSHAEDATPTDDATNDRSSPKFCQQCGAKLSEGKFCPSCGSPVSGGSNDGGVGGGAGRKKPSLWNPNAVANWSLLFTPIFGSYLNKKNWLELGEKGRAKGSSVWFWISIVVVATLALSPELPPASGLIYLIIWYFAAGKPQVNYVKKELGDEYEKKSWAGPVFSGIGIIFGLLVLFVAMEDYEGGSAWGQVPACDSRNAKSTLTRAFDNSQFARVFELSVVEVKDIRESSFDKENNTRNCTADVVLNNLETVSVRYELEGRDGGEYMLKFEVQ